MSTCASRTCIAVMAAMTVIFVRITEGRADVVIESLSIARGDVLGVETPIGSFSAGYVVFGNLAWTVGAGAQPIWIHFKTSATPVGDGTVPNYVRLYAFQISNQSLYGWLGFDMQLGSGLFDSFAQSPGLDSLAFLPPPSSPMPGAGPFQTFSFSSDQMILSNGLLLPIDQAPGELYALYGLEMKIAVPMGQSDFTLQLRPVVPAPGSFSLFAAAAVPLFNRRRRLAAGGLNRILPYPEEPGQVARLSLVPQFRPAFHSSMGNLCDRLM